VDQLLHSHFIMDFVLIKVNFIMSSIPTKFNLFIMDFQLPSEMYLIMDLELTLALSLIFCAYQ